MFFRYYWGPLIRFEFEYEIEYEYGFFKASYISRAVDIQASRKRRSELSPWR